MGKKKAPCICPKCLPGWLASFGDMMSLLLCFFVLLLSMSTMDAKKVQDVVGSLAGALSVLEGGAKSEISREKQQQDNPVQIDSQSANHLVKQIKQQIQEINEMQQSQGSPKVTIKETQEGFVIKLPASLLFKPASALITNEDAFLFLRRIALIIKKMPKDVQLDAVGYTDNTPPPQDSGYADNWELSSARAISVAKELIKDSVNPERIIASGRAQFDPIATNATEDGKLRNRRVELHFYSKKASSNSVAKKTILDQAQE